MAVKRYRITIEGTQTVDGESEKLHFSTEGSYRLEGRRARLSYDDTELTGYAGSRTVICAEAEEQASIERTGQSASTLTVRPGERRQSYYDIGVGCVSVAVNGLAVENRLRPDGGTLRLRYALDLESNIVSDNIVSITGREISNARQIHL